MITNQNDTFYHACWLFNFCPNIFGLIFLKNRKVKIIWWKVKYLFCPPPPPPPPASPTIPYAMCYIYVPVCTLWLYIWDGLEFHTVHNLLINFIEICSFCLQSFNFVLNCVLKAGTCKKLARNLECLNREGNTCKIKLVCTTMYM